MFERVIDEDFVLTEKACACFMKQICEAMEYIHSKKVIHLDMKVSDPTKFHNLQDIYEKKHYDFKTAGECFVYFKARKSHQTY